MIFNIQRYSTHDGPGIRTVVFLKGCSLGCRWCQNPESRARSEDLLYDSRLCLAGCELCQQAAPAVITRTLDGLIIHRQNVNDSHIAALRDSCPTTALTVCGEEKSVEEIMATVLRDKPFYDRSGGGVTLSGGEPFMNPTLAQALFEASHQAGIHTAVETCLHVPWKYIEPSLPFVDLFLADLKHVDEAVFQQWTDGSARRVLDNLQRLALAGKNDYSRAVDPGIQRQRSRHCRDHRFCRRPPAGQRDPLPAVPHAGNEQIPVTQSALHRTGQTAGCS